jgi:hypothetical protein
VRHQDEMTAKRTSGFEGSVVSKSMAGKDNKAAKKERKSLFGYIRKKSDSGPVVG